MRAVGGLAVVVAVMAVAAIPAVARTPAERITFGNVTCPVTPPSAR